MTPLADLVHLRAGRSGLQLATRRGLLHFPRALFAGAGGPAALEAAIREAIAALPDGASRAAELARLDARSRRGPRLRLSLLLPAACVIAFALQRALPGFDDAGRFHAELVRAGELWRLVTANFLHEGAPHLAVNAFSLWALAALLERCVGARRTALVAAASAGGAMVGSTLAGYGWALGASGIAAGLAGALVVLELGRPELIPTRWRLRRAPLLLAVAAEAALLALVPGVAHAAHAGGLLAGAATLWAATPARGAALPASRPQAALVAASVALAALAFARLGLEAATPEPYERARMERLLARPDASADLANDLAWQVAVSRPADPALLAVAVALAERAVAETGRRDPNALDTLAELHFRRGERAAALACIDEALALAPADAYLRGQRRRMAPHAPAPAGPGEVAI